MPTIRTAKGEHTAGTLREICEWQARTQGAAAEIMMEPYSLDVSDVEFETRPDGHGDRALDATVERVIETLAADCAEEWRRAAADGDSIGTPESPADGDLEALAQLLGCQTSDLWDEHQEAVQVFERAFAGLV